MTASIRPEPPKRGRRAGDPAETRTAILEAALRCFAERGYAATSVRAIAKAARVDPALVTHYFGTKEQLFLTAHRVPDDPAALITDALRRPPHERGEALARVHLERFLTAPGGAGVSLVRSAATDPLASQLLREVLNRALMAHAPALVGDREDAPARLACISATLIGTVFHARILEIAPLAHMDASELARHIGPAIQRLLDGGAKNDAVESLPTA